MLELCFDMSTRGALRVAQRCGGSGRKASDSFSAAQRTAEM